MRNYLKVLGLLFLNNLFPKRSLQKVFYFILIFFCFIIKLFLTFFFKKIAYYCYFFLLFFCSQELRITLPPNAVCLLIHPSFFFSFLFLSNGKKKTYKNIQKIIFEIKIKITGKPMRPMSVSMTPKEVKERITSSFDVRSAVCISFF